MAKQEDQLSINQLIELFEDGLERYNTEAVFNKCINMLHQGTSVYEVLDMVLLMQKKNSQILAQYIMKDGIKPLIGDEEE